MTNTFSRLFYSDATDLLMQQFSLGSLYTNSLVQLHVCT